MFKDIFKTIITLTDSLGLKELFKGKETKLQEFTLKLAEQMNDLNTKQIELNKIEAKHTSIFVSGWRPFIGWICGSALAYNFIIQPLIIYIAQLFEKNIVPPELNIGELISILLAMLGMYGTRTYEKIKIKKSNQNVTLK